MAAFAKRCRVPVPWQAARYRAEVGRAARQGPLAGPPSVPSGQRLACFAQPLKAFQVCQSRASRLVLSRLVSLATATAKG